MSNLLLVAFETTTNFHAFCTVFFRAELGGVQRSVSNLNFSLSGCCVALLNFWCPEVRLEFFKVSRGPCSILTFGCPEVRLDF